MQDVAKLLNEMKEKSVIDDYAVFGAVAQMRYTEAVATLDADVLVSLRTGEGLDILTPIYQFCAERAYPAEGEAIRVGDWPVQFIPAFDRLTHDAIAYADDGDIDGEPMRVVSAAFLGVIALSVGRPKDYARILALLDADAITVESLAALADQYDLENAWLKFTGRFIDD